MHNDPLPENAAGSSSRALAVLGAPTTGRASAVRPRDHAGFVTQLIACERGLPAYRARRRADPSDATRLYGARPARAATPSRDLAC